MNSRVLPYLSVQTVPGSGGLPRTKGKVADAATEREGAGAARAVV